MSRAPAVVALAVVAMLNAGVAPALGESTGTLRSWGWNYSGQLGDGTLESRASPVKVKKLDDVKALAAGSDHVLAVRSAGRVWAWGDNRFGQLGLGSVGQPNELVPRRVPGLSDVVAVAAGWVHSLALRADGTVWAWGINDRGQLGTGGIGDSGVPTRLRGLDRVIALAAGDEHSVALRADGTVWTWGGNGSGQLGDGTQQDRLRPVPVTGLTGVVAISASFADHTLALRSDGTVWGWGESGSGQLGQGDAFVPWVLEPVVVPGLSNIARIDVGFLRSWAIGRDGRAWAWGWGPRGELCLQEDQVNSPTRVPAADNALTIDSGGYHTLIHRPDGSVDGCGWNRYGQLGTGSFGGFRRQPTQVTGLGSVKAVAAGNLSSFAML